MGLGIGFLLAAGLAIGSEFLDDRVYDEEELKKLLSVGIIAEIPGIATMDEDRQQRANLKMLLAAAAMMFVTIAIGSALSFFKG
jgi:hypothetical protein